MDRESEAGWSPITAIRLQHGFCYIIGHPGEGKKCNGTGKHIEQLQLVCLDKVEIEKKSDGKDRKHGGIVGFQLGMKALLGSKKQTGDHNAGRDCSEKQSGGKTGLQMTSDREQTENSSRQNDTVFTGRKEDIRPVHSHLLLGSFSLRRRNRCSMSACSSWVCLRVLRGKVRLSFIRQISPSMDSA